jgi:hypothetical protein
MNNLFYNNYYLVLKIIIIVLFIQIVFHVKRHIITKIYYNSAKKLAQKKNKKLIVLGDPCSGNIFMFIQKLFPNSSHGDITIDLYGCSNCHKFDINNIEKWKQFENDKYVIIDIAVLSFGKDLQKILTEIKRISGGDFYSSGGTTTMFWKYIGHKFYSQKYPNSLYHMIYPFLPGDEKYKAYDFITKKIQYYNF